ncbi:MAG: nucleotidyltransferase domain-containing protein [Nitrospirae bacterium]|nr:nucleotidyltransferase domain-containing protein [Nitrospirota bacterium]
MSTPSLLEVHQRVLKIKEQLVEQLGEGLRSAILFGSAVTGDFLPGVSDVNLLLAVKSGMKLPLLPSKFVRKLERDLRASPAVWFEDRLPDLPRIFPIEIREIVQFHRCLHGEDPFAQNLVQPEDLNRAVRAGLFRLHSELQKNLILGDAERSPFDTLYDLVFLVRGFLRTQQLQPARAKKDSLEQFAEQFDTALTTAKVLLSVRDHTLGPPGEHEREQMFGYYLRDVERVLEVVEKRLP